MYSHWRKIILGLEARCVSQREPDENQYTAGRRDAARRIAPKMACAPNRPITRQKSQETAACAF